MPNRLAVLGGGYLGVEFAAIYRRFGSDVTILEQGPALFRHEDDDVAAVATAILADEGIALVTGARIEKVRDTGQDTAVLSYQDAHGQHELEVDLILAAAGRTPVTTISVWRPRASRPMHGAPSSSTSTCAPASRTSSRSATSTAARSSPTSRSTTAGSSPTNSSATARGR